MTLLSLLPLGKVLLAFFAMLAGIRLRIGLALSIIIGSILLALLFGMGLIEWGQAAIQGIFQEQTLFLASIVALILVFSDLLDHSGQAGRLLDALSGRIRKPRLSLAFFPALIGLLPMPGGAVFSAPMVRTMAEKLEKRRIMTNVSPVDQALINYWYRHIWELAWPLYPGVILAASLSGIGLVHLAFILSPSPIIGLIAGWYFVLRPATSALAEAEGNEQEHLLQPIAPPAPWSKILLEGAPLLVAILGAIALEVGISLLAPDMPFEWGVIAALLGAITTSALQNKVSPLTIAGFFTRRHLLTMMSVIVGIFVFKEVLQVSGAVHRLAETAGGDAALFGASVILPFFVGLVSGINMAFVGAAMPLVLALVQQLGLQGELHAWVTLTMFAGYAGVMASPLHLCFILTCQFFDIELSKAWRRLLPPCFCLVIGGLAYFMLLRAFS